MAYTALPDRRMPFDNDGTRVAYGAATASTSTPAFGGGITGYLDGTARAEINDADYADPSIAAWVTGGGNSSGHLYAYWFFPEQRELTATAIGGWRSFASWTASQFIATGTELQGSNDSTNGVDGTFETASFPSGLAFSYYPNDTLDGWRTTISPVSFTGGKRVIRLGLRWSIPTGQGAILITTLHLYGEKAAGQTPDDIIYIDHDTTPGVEFTAPEDFGDRPLATTVTRQFRLKNVSGTLTANSINLQCNDADFAISENGTSWVTTIDIASLAAGAESATLYIRNTTPAVGSLLGPRFARIVTTVASWA